MSVKNDILIYVPFKKENYTESYVKWVDNFEAILKIALKQIVKNDITISSFTPQNKSGDINSEIDKSKVILTLLLDENLIPENYLPIMLSEKIEGCTILQIYCNPELKQVAIEGSCITKSINFYNEALKEVIDLSENYQNLEDEVWLKFLDLSFEIRKTIKSDHKESDVFKEKIFIAETSKEQNRNKENIIRELEHLGFEILPKNKFPGDLEPFSELAYNNLKESFLSIHIIGNDYLPLLNNIDVSSVEIQNDLFIEVAAELNKETEKIKRLVWISPDIKYKSEKQRLYVESFKRNIELLKNTEIVQAPIEIFKTIIRAKIKEAQEKKTVKEERGKKVTRKSVYVISDEKDSKIYKDIKSLFTKKGIEILETSENNNKIELIREHYNSLINCDAVLINYSANNEQWINSKLRDILKSPGFGRKKKYLAKSVLVNVKKKPEIVVQLDNLDIFNNSQLDIAKRLNSFIEKIK